MSQHVGEVDGGAVDGGAARITVDTELVEGDDMSLTGQNGFKNVWDDAHCHE